MDLGVGNDDYPDERLPTRNPLRFPSVPFDFSVNMNVRVYHPEHEVERVVEDVLIRDVESSDEEDNSSNVVAFELADGDNRDRAYWLQSTLMKAIYGRVRLATVLRKRNRTENDTILAEWEITNERCAVKQMSRQQINKNRQRLAENPIQEIHAMQYISSSLLPIGGNANREAFASVMNEYNVLLPLDVLFDDKYLYSIMPYCNGGELFTRLDESTRFTEAQARYWMRQILQGVQTLQDVGICHRDMSLENILIHDNNCYIMDFGMCCRVPFTNIQDDSEGVFLPNMRGDRQMLNADRTMGKWSYMSPEIAQSNEPFDGFAIDLWAVGAMLFTMVAGFHPWSRPDRAEERFLYLTGGYLERMLTEWGLGLSPAILDLLQKMLFYDARDRLSLAQILAHPWMQGEVEAPDIRPSWS